MVLPHMDTVIKHEPVTSNIKSNKMSNFNFSKMNHKDVNCDAVFKAFEFELYKLIKLISQLIQYYALMLHVTILQS